MHFFTFNISVGDTPTSSSSSGFIGPGIDAAPVEPDGPDAQEDGDARPLAMPPPSRRGRGKGRDEGTREQVYT